jgi:hypothetical protein
MSNKYGAKKATEDGYTFDSLAERRRYRDLKLMLKAGEITNLEVHPVWQLVVCGVKIGRYTADFAYNMRFSGKRFVEDVKGVKTRDYLLRKKLMKALHGIDVQEIQA